MMVEALKGSLEPKVVVFPIDTGLGKSTLIKSFLRLWKAEGFKPEGSILVALKTKAEIEGFTRACGLDDSDFAVFTADERLNALGMGINKYDSAKVLFTTHAMIEAKTERNRFEKARGFYYQGKRRSLCIWDERANRACNIHLTCDDLFKLVGEVRPYYPEWAGVVEAFTETCKKKSDGTVVIVPVDFGSAKRFKPAPNRAPILNNRLKDIYRMLKRAQGKKVMVCAGKQYGTTLIGAGSALPDDIGPMFVFDGSARIGDTYELWAKTGNLTIMPPVVRSYSKLTIRLWKMDSGNTVLQDADKKHHLLKAIATALNEDSEPTLLIGKMAKSPLFDLENDLRAYLRKPDDLVFRHWGVHYGTNEFAGYKQLVVIGTHQNRDTVDKSIYLAASGVDAHAIEGDEWVRIGRAEMKQNLLQAISRGYLRNGRDGECGECVVYLIAPPTCDPEGMVREVFPGCVVEEWRPYEVALKGQAKRVFEVINKMVEEGRVGRIEKQEIREAVPITMPSRLAKVLANPVLVRKLRNIGISIENKHLHIAAKPISIARFVDERAKKKKLVSSDFLPVLAEAS